MYVPNDGRPLSDKLLVLLACDAIALKVEDLAIQRDGAWTFLGSNTDWLRLGNFRNLSPAELFDFIVPLVEAGQNSIRHEVVVHALADRVVLFGPEGCSYLSPFGSEPPKAELLEQCRGLNKRRVIAFVAIGRASPSASLAA